jgi:hypothetical protein
MEESTIDRSGLGGFEGFGRLWWSGKEAAAASPKVLVLGSSAALHAQRQRHNESEDLSQDD